MTKISKRLGAVLVGLALATPAGSTDAGDRSENAKVDYSTVGSAPQFLTTAELLKSEAAHRMSAPAADRSLESRAAPLPAKPASFSTVRTGTATNVAPDVAKQSSATQLETRAPSGRPARPKPPERFTSEPAAPGLTAAETAKIEALRRKGAMQPAPGRSQR